MEQMKRYFFHISDDRVEIRDKMGVVLPDSEDLVEFCRSLVLAVVLEDDWEGEPSDQFIVTVEDVEGNEVATIPFGASLVDNLGDAAPRKTAFCTH